MSESVTAQLYVALNHSVVEYRLTNKVLPSCHIFHEEVDNVDVFKMKSKLDIPDENVELFKTQMLDQINSQSDVSMVFFVNRAKVSSPHINSDEIILAQGFVPGWKFSLAVPIDPNGNITDGIHKIDFIDHVLDEMFVKIHEV